MSDINYTLAILKMYPTLQNLIDFRCEVWEGMQSITDWNNSNPKPTDDQLQSAWFEVLKDQKKSSLNAQCNVALVSGFQSSALGTAHTYPSHDKAQANFNTEMHCFLMDSTYTSCNFYTEDVGWLEHTKDQFSQVFKDGHDYGNAQWQKLFSLLAKVDALAYPTNTEVDINAITW